MSPMKTPGVYVDEKSAFPNSVVQVASAVPAFIGYTEFAQNGEVPLHMTPMRLTSMAEFQTYFGGPSHPIYEIKTEEDWQDTKPDDPETATKSLEFAHPKASYKAGEDSFWLREATPAFQLYAAMCLFFQNGGEACYIISVGTYRTEDAQGAQMNTPIDADDLLAGIDLLEKEREPTLLVVPETVSLTPTEAISVQKAMLTHCGGEMKNRFAMLDISQGYRELDDKTFQPVDAFRDTIGIDYLNFGASYYPWLDSTVFGSRDFTFENIATDDLKLLADQLCASVKNDPEIVSEIKKILPPEPIKASASSASDEDVTPLLDLVEPPPPVEVTDKALRAICPLYNDIMAAIAQHQNCLASAAAIAGLYTMVDNTRGVWKAPANISVNSVTAPSVKVSHEEQETLNVSTTGKSINAIRAFVGEGTLVWGAHTLDGNSLHWRYINVRRTMITIEESIRLACKAYVFEPNAANTWFTMKSMIENFLTSVWKQGGLAGAIPEDAFSVHVGLGVTMTPVDILEGRLILTVLVAVSRPAEFIEITISQQMQKS